MAGQFQASHSGIYDSKSVFSNLELGSNLKIKNSHNITNAISQSLTWCKSWLSDDLVWVGFMAYQPL